MEFFKALWDLITNPLITLVLIFAILEKIASNSKR